VEQSARLNCNTFDFGADVHIADDENRLVSFGLGTLLFLADELVDLMIFSMGRDRSVFPFVVALAVWAAQVSALQTTV